MATLELISDVRWREERKDESDESQWNTIMGFPRLARELKGYFIWHFHGDANAISTAADHVHVPCYFLTCCIVNRVMIHGVFTCIMSI